MEKELYLEGLGCAACAQKIETRVKNLDGVVYANLNFSVGILSIKADKGNMQDIIKEVIKIVKSIEPNTNVILEKQKKHIHKTNKGVNHKKMIILFIGVLFFVFGTIFEENSYTIILFLISYIVITKEILYASFKNILKGEVFDENFLMSIATITAFILGFYEEAIMVGLLYQIGEYLQHRAVNSSRKNIEKLMDIRPDYANLKIKDGIKKVNPSDVNVGDIIVVKSGEKIPLDGEIISGSSTIDASAITGEFIPQDVIEGDKAVSGCVNIEGLISIKVTKVYKESTAAKILDLVQNAASKKAKTEKFITKFARYYTPTVVFLALAIAVIPPLVIEGASFSVWIYRAATFLVVSCPCALIISIPLGYFAGLGACSKKGILVKGSNYLEALNKVDSVIFDKTGTLTNGNLKVSSIKAESSFTKDEILKCAAMAESFSNHPISKSIVAEYKKAIDSNQIKNYKEYPGKGITVTINNKSISVGNSKLMKETGINYGELNTDGTVVYIAIDNIYAGYIIIKDEIKEDSGSAIKQLKNKWISKVIMLTGDRKLNALNTAKTLNIDEVHYELMPHEKLDIIDEIIKNSSEGVAFVGDGINDAPALARADIGIAMGGIGSDAAIEAADIVIMDDKPSRIVHAFKLAARTRKIVLENIVLALGIKFAVLLLAVIGYASMWLAVFADVGVALLAVLNSIRILKNN